jgi:hypothetical protein
VLYGSDYCWTPAPGVTAQVASVDAASLDSTADGTGDSAGGTNWRALTSRNAAKLLPRLWSLRHHARRSGRRRCRANPAGTGGTTVR